MAGTGKGAPLGALALGAAVGLRAAWRRANAFDFKGKSVAITGGSRGLGLVLAREFAAKGARVTLLARDADELERAALDIRSHGADVLAFPCDVRDRDQARDAVERVVQQFGRIDVLVNDAGIIQVGPVEHMTLDDFQDAMAVHAWAALYTMSAAAPHMRRQGGGRIVNIASIGGLVAIPHLLPYTMSKFALVGLSDGMRAELAKDGIRVTTVCPGLMRTGSHVNALFKGQHRAEFTWFTLGNAMPVASIDARRAARQIVEACRYGEPQLTITIQARSMAIANAVFPNTTARLLALVNRLLPGPTNAHGDHSWTGWESETPLAPSPLTVLSDKAIEENNEEKATATV